MRILHLSTWTTGGAAKAGERLSDELVDQGIASQVLHMSNKIPAYIDAAIGKLTHTTNPIFHSYNYYGEDISRQINNFKPDILHIHWIGAGFIRPESLGSYNLPIVWTLHDLWPFCGAEHLPASTRFTEGYLQDNRASGESGLDLDRYVWKRKIKAFKNLDVTFVAPSHYVYEQAKKSKAIGNHKLVYIPNGVDSDIFKPQKTKITFKPTIFFAAMNPGLDPNKGYDDFVKAGDLLPKKLREQVKIKVIGGEITGDTQMARLYQQASITVVPSKIENLSFVTMESMACGTPVVAYGVGGIPDLIDHKINGYLAKPADIKDLSRGITQIISNPHLAKQYSRAGRDKIMKQFDISSVAKQYSSLYQSLI